MPGSWSANGLRARGVARGEAAERAGQLLERLGAAHLADRSTAHLSGGEQRRIAIARAVVLAPKLLLPDEPLAELDDDGCAQVVELVRSLSDTTVLVASPTALPQGLADREIAVERPTPQRVG